MTVYNKLIVYQKSRELTVFIYKLTKKFPYHEIQGLTSQIRRAAVSVCLNISEGSARSTDKQFYNFINIAIGSITETKVCLEISLDLGYISKEDHDSAFNQSEEISKMLFSLRKSLSADG